MTPPPDINSSNDRLFDLTLLAVRYFDGLATPDEINELNQQLEADAELRDLFVVLSIQLGALPELISQEPEWVDSQQEISEETASHSTAAFPEIEVKPATFSRRHKRYDSIHWQRHKIRFNAMTAVLTALAWAGFSYFVWYSTTPDSRPSRTGEDFNFVAYISGVYEHQWAEEMRPMAPNSSMAVGERLQLVAGYIEITFFDGAVVVLEAPVDFVIESRGAGTLNEGKLTANVPQEAIGFTVETLQATFTDLGTEFGVAVARDGSAQLHVFEGRVSAETQSRPGHLSSVSLVEAGRSLVISHEGVVSHGEAVAAAAFSQLPDRPSTVPSGPGIVITLQGTHPLRDPRVITLSDFATGPDATVDASSAFVGVTASGNLSGAVFGSIDISVEAWGDMAIDGSNILTLTEDLVIGRNDLTGWSALGGPGGNLLGNDEGARDALAFTFDLSGLTLPADTVLRLVGVSVGQIAGSPEIELSVNGVSSTIIGTGNNVEINTFVTSVDLSDGAMLALSVANSGGKMRVRSLTLEAVTTEELPNLTALE